VSEGGGEIKRRRGEGDRGMEKRESADGKHQSTDEEYLHCKQIHPYMDMSWTVFQEPKLGPWE
jgi:hypothetical protein